jgi:uncharacterized protein (DUF2147 family)
MSSAPDHVAVRPAIPMPDRPLRPAPEAVSATAELSRDEWTAVLLSAHDGRRSLLVGRTRGRLGRFFLGERRSAQLTSTRLEALRRYAVLYRLQGAGLAWEEDARLRAAGFSDRQAEAVRAIVDSFGGPKRADGAAWGATATLLAVTAISATPVLLVDRWLAAQLDDQLGALMLSILMTTGFVSFLCVAGHPHGGNRRPAGRHQPKWRGRWAALALAMLAGSSLIPTSPANAAPVEGIWQNRNGTMEVQVAPCGRAYCGTVVAARGAAIADAREGGLTRLVGTTVMKDYAQAADGSWHGSVFVPKLGRHLSSKLIFVDADTVQISGCVLGGLVCKAKTWRRLSQRAGRVLASAR